MYKVLVVDDEKPARETLMHLIKWDNTEFRIIGSATEGKEALEKYQLYQPDLIITDIQMPIMDGLELIKQIRLHDQEQRFVILSCHEDFCYAREAIKMGVSDYLLKDLLTPQDLYGVLEKVKGDIKRSSDRKAVTIVRKQGIPNDEFRGAALRSIVFSKQDQLTIREYLENLSLNPAGEYVLLCILVDDYKKIDFTLSQNEEKQLTDAMVDIIRASLNKFFGGECFYNREGEFIAVVGLDGAKSQLKNITDCHAICQSIRDDSIRMENLSLTIGISRVFAITEGCYDRYVEANRVTKNRLFLGKGKNLFYNLNIPLPINIKPEVLSQRQNNIKANLDNGNIDLVIKEVRKLYNQDLKGFMQYNYIKHVNSNLLNTIIEFCGKNDICYEDIFNKNYVPFDELDSIDTVQELSDWYIDVFSKMTNIWLQKSKANYSRRVKDAINYIKENYASEVSLNQIAEELSLHKVYLSRVFKQETGENLTDYINKYRVEKAKQLIISTNYKLYEIAEKTGFTNAQTFSLTFKKVTGHTPIEFRDKSI